MDDEPPAIEIPETFHSAYEEGPFRSCVDCTQPLAEADGYVIQKVQKRGETIFEFALCNSCHKNLVAECSTETRERLNRHVEDNLQDLNAIDRCSICLRDSSAFDEYGITAHCVDRFLFYQLCMCNDCRMGMDHLISDQTRRSWDDFVGKNFPGVPSMADKPMLI